MVKETHIRGGYIFSLIFLPLIYNQIPNNYSLMYKLILILIYIYFSYLGSLFPDIDMKNSYLSKRVPFLYKYFGRYLRHRGFTHSLIFLLAINYIQKYIISFTEGNIVFVFLCSGFIVGCLSHILLDLITKEGIEFLYPLSFNFSLLPIKTSSKTEKIIYKCFNFLIIFLLGYRFYIFF